MPPVEIRKLRVRLEQLEDPETVPVDLGHHGEAVDVIGTAGNHRDRIVRLVREGQVEPGGLDATEDGNPENQEHPDREQPSNGSHVVLPALVVEEVHRRKFTPKRAEERG